MTFHQKVEEAAAFAEKLPKTTAEPYMNDASNEDLAAADKLPKSSIDAELYELEAGRHVPPDRTGSGRRGCAATTSSPSGARFCAGSPTASTPPVAGSTALSSPAFAFACSVRAWTSPANGESRPSAARTPAAQVEIVQNIGRAHRLNKDGSTKVARIIVPVSLEPGEDPTDMVTSASFRPLVAVFQGLRSHDERLVEQLASRALTSGKRKAGTVR